MKNKVLIAIVMASLFVTNVIAQNKTENFSIGLQFGTIEYSGEIVQEIFSFDSGIHPSLGLNIAKYVTPSFNLRGSFRVGTVDGSNGIYSFKNRLFDINVLLDYKFNNGYILKETSMFAPYVFIGAGDALSMYTNKITGIEEQPLAYFNIPMGAGIKLNLTSEMAISIETHYNYAITDELDGVISGANNWDDSFLYNSIGFNYNFISGTDSDGDGIKDKYDKCPNISGSNKGCPEDYFEHIVILQNAQKGLFFNTSSSVIKEESFAVLDKIVELLNANKDLELDVTGHANNLGGEAINLKLSNERAAAVKTYIESKGIEGARISSKVYGDTKAIANNTTEEGRIQNRRVEIRIKY